MLRGMRVVAAILINILNETSYVVFIFCRFSLFLKDPFSILFTCDHYIKSGLELIEIAHFEVCLTAIVPLGFHGLL